jgi:hypothetical protein
MAANNAASTQKPYVSLYSLDVKQALVKKLPPALKTFEISAQELISIFARPMSYSDFAGSASESLKDVGRFLKQECVNMLNARQQRKSAVTSICLHATDENMSCNLKFLIRKSDNTLTGAITIMVMKDCDPEICSALKNFAQASVKTMSFSEKYNRLINTALILAATGLLATTLQPHVTHQLALRRERKLNELAEQNAPTYFENYPEPKNHVELKKAAIKKDSCDKCGESDNESCTTHLACVICSEKFAKGTPTDSIIITHKPTDGPSHIFHKTCLYTAIWMDRENQKCIGYNQPHKRYKPICPSCEQPLGLEYPK